METSIKFYFFNQKVKILGFFNDLLQTNKKIESYYFKAFKSKKKKIILKRFMRFMKNILFDRLKREKEIQKILLNKYRVNYHYNI